MKVLVCVLFFASCAQCKFLKESEVMLDIIGEKREQIVDIFQNVSTLSIFLKNYEQPKGLAQFLESIFGAMSFSVNNFSDEETYKEWIENCRAFKNNTAAKTAYYERLFLKSHDPTSKDSESTADPINAIPTSKEILQESFAERLDRWFTFRKSGFILFCPFTALELYLGCLLNRGGTFLFIIEENSEKGNQIKDVAEILRRAWQSSTNLKLFVLIYRELYVLNPFAIDDTSNRFGVLEKLSNRAINRNFRTFNDYPMNIELFYSAYSVTKGKNFTGKLDMYFGPDAEVARFIQSQLNVSSEWTKNY